MSQLRMRLFKKPAKHAQQLRFRESMKIITACMACIIAAVAFSDSKAQSYPRTGPYKYYGQRCDPSLGPFDDAGTALSATMAKNYSVNAWGEQSCGYHTTGSTGWGVAPYTRSICGANNWPSYSHDNIERANVDSYSTNFGVLRWDSVKNEFNCVRSDDSVTVLRERIVCPTDQVYYSESIGCVRLKEVDRLKPPPGQCFRVGNPIEPLTGTKRQVLGLSVGLPGLPFVLQYDSAARRINSDHLPAPQTGHSNAMLGAWLWYTNIHREVIRQAANRVVVGRGDGGYSQFQSSGNWQFAPGDFEANRLLAVEAGFGFQDIQSGRFEVFDSNHRQLLLIQGIDGKKFEFVYSTTFEGLAVPRHLDRIVDPYGRVLKFVYQRLNPESEPLDRIILSEVQAPEGVTLKIGRVAGQITHVRFVDDTTQSLLYEDPRHPWALTGLVDEAAVRLSSFSYDEEGNAVTTERAGGIERFEVSHAMRPLRVTTESLDAPNKILYRIHHWRMPAGVSLRTPSGSESDISLAGINEYPSPTGMSQPAGSGCDAATSKWEYGSGGLVAWREDFNGHRTCYSHNASRYLETVRVEGLAKNTSCAVTADNEPLPSGSRKISTDWHPVWRLETKRAEPGRITRHVYNGQPDPAGGTARCAPTTAKLPDGSPIAVLCKRIEEATLDANGREGFLAVVDSTVPPKIDRWTYDQNGQVLTHDGPRTDVSDVSLYEYYDDTGDDWTKGDLKTFTNPADVVTRYTKYARDGKVLEAVDGNDVVTKYSYDLRRRLKTINIAGAITEYDYFPTGLLKQVTQPDGSYIAYEYDEAQRQTAVRDSLGNRIDYELDARGGRKQERVRDPSGVLRRNIERGFDPLGRLEKETGGYK